jgi:hypothetical protein
MGPDGNSDLMPIIVKRRTIPVADVLAWLDELDKHIGVAERDIEDAVRRATGPIVKQRVASVSGEITGIRRRAVEMRELLNPSS